MTLFGYKLINQKEYDSITSKIIALDESLDLSRHSLKDEQRRSSDLFAENCKLRDNNETLEKHVRRKQNIIDVLEEEVKGITERPILNDVQDVLTELRKLHPDKMLLDEGFTDFQRGREVGYIELIEEIAALVAPEIKQEEADDGEQRY